MNKKNFAVIIPFLFVFVSMAQHPFIYWTDAVEMRYDRKQPVINYTLSIDAADLSFINIEMRIRNVPDTFHVAMVTHPEYDDRYWRFIENFTVDGKNGRGNILREDSSLWRITSPGGEAVLHYRIHLPPAQEGQRAAWRPFLSATGGLVGGPHSFMYVVGATLAPSHINLKLPSGWKVATGLEATSDPNIFFAPTSFVLTDCPILVGQFKNWSFTVDGTPHRVVYLPLPNATIFDTTTFVKHIQQFVQQVDNLFGRLPYREYSFLLQDGAYGALEHCNSVTIGAPSDQLAKNISSSLGEISHEFFHTWNLMRIHPAEYADVDYKKPLLSRGLWWSEGLTMLYADLLRRRAGLPVFDSTRIKHLETLISRYFGSPGNNKISPELVSLAAYGPAGMLGDYSASTHLQGELLGTMLDLIIRNATDGQKNIDDVMRKMMERFSGANGFTGKDIEQAVTDVCGCNVHSFFEDHVRGNKFIDFNKYLQLAGLHSNISWDDAKGDDGKKYADLRIYGWQKPNENPVRIGITDPSGCWAKAGLHTGDIINTINGTVIKTTRDFWQTIRAIQIGDTVSMEVQHEKETVKLTVVVGGYKQPVVHIEDIRTVSAKQEKLRTNWIAGN